MAIQTQTVTYFDDATIYLTEEQVNSYYLMVRVNILSYRPPISLSFARNPPQSVWGWVTGVDQEAVVFETGLRFDYQQIYEDYDSYKQLAQLLCLYYQATSENLGSLGQAIPTSIPFTIKNVNQLSPFVRRRLDSIRVRTLVPTTFSIELFWLPDMLTGECAGALANVPPPAPPGGSPNPPGPDSSSPGANPIANGGIPIGPMSSIPPGAYSGDFGGRNNATPARYSIRVVGEAINGRGLGCSVLDPTDDTFILEGIGSDDPGDYTVTLDGGPVAACAGANSGFNLRYLGQVVASAGPAGFYNPPVVVSATRIN